MRLTRTLTFLAELKQDSNAFPVVANIEEKATCQMSCHSPPGRLDVESVGLTQLSTAVYQGVDTRRWVRHGSVPQSSWINRQEVSGEAYCRA